MLQSIDLVVIHVYVFNCFSLFFSQSRGELEQQSIETANTAEAVSFITYVQSLKRKMKNWEKEVEVRLVPYTS